MINRRSLRIKAFKQLYALESSKKANYQIALDLLDERFSPDLNSMEVVDKDELDRKKKLAMEEFRQLVEGSMDEQALDEEVSEDVKEAVQYLENQNEQDFKMMLESLEKEAKKVIKDHLLALSLLEELANQNKRHAEEKQDLAEILGEKAIVRLNFFRNRVIAKITGDKTYGQLKKEYKIEWGGQEDLLRDWYKGVLNKDEQFREYLRKENPDYAEDWAIVDYICRKVVFKNDVFDNFFEDIDIDWVQNKPIVRSLVLKTVKSVKDENDELHIADVSYNWEDDSEYVKTLFRKTVEEDGYLEELLEGKLKNWNIDRLALTDKVLLKMALAEMIWFPSIPTKVTINEFIEISKTYSTPKSKKFINGLLDSLAIDLSEKGVIRKSGRGLIDNK